MEMEKCFPGLVIREGINCNENKNSSPPFLEKKSLGNNKGDRSGHFCAPRAAQSQGDGHGASF